jgi:nucleoid DNA-binding protein
MNKTELIKEVARITGKSVSSEKKTLEAILKVIGDVLAEGDVVRFNGFGSFSATNVPPRNYRNPQNGAIVKTNGSKKVRFKGGSNLQGKVS